MPCKFYSELINKPNLVSANNFYENPGYRVVKTNNDKFKRGYPWLFYKDTNAKVILTKDRIKFRASFDLE